MENIMGIRRALLVGINYPGTTYPLQGCVNDVNLMADILTQHYGFTDATQRRMLTDHSATTDNILERLNWLTEKTWCIVVHFLSRLKFRESR